jgi:hypothetical protein
MEHEENIVSYPTIRQTIYKIMGSLFKTKIFTVCFEIRDNG